MKDYVEGKRFEKLKEIIGELDKQWVSNGYYPSSVVELALNKMFNLGYLLALERMEDAMPNYRGLGEDETATEFQNGYNLCIDDTHDRLKSIELTPKDTE